MTTKLWPHQRVGADWLIERNRAYLGDRPRVGKTRTLATALNDMRATVEVALVICPAIVRTHWRETLADVMGSGAAMVHVKSYHEIVNQGEQGRDELLEMLHPNVLILDEAHLLKTMTAQRTRLILGKDGYARRIPIVWAASGTPVPRHPGEMYAILSTMWPRLMWSHGLKRYEDFETRFLVQRKVWAGQGKPERLKVVGMQNDGEFKELLQATTLRRTLDDIGPEQPKLLWQVLALDGETAAVKAETRKLPPGLALSNVYENASHIRKLVGIAKVAPVVSMIVSQLAESREKLVVFAHHLDVLTGIQDGLAAAGIGCTRIDGSTTAKQRDMRLTQFRGRDQVFLGQNIACQMGIDLSAASSILLVEPDWTATVNDQIGHRILGPMQTAKHVVAQMISLAGTIDDSIVRQNAREAAMQDRMFGRP